MNRAFLSAPSVRTDRLWDDTVSYSIAFVPVIFKHVFAPSAVSFCEEHPERAGERERDRLRGLPLQSLSTKATKHASVNISVASAPRPGSCCSLSAGPQSESLYVPWPTALWTWLACCVEAAVPACMQEQRRGSDLMFLCV